MKPGDYLDLPYHIELVHDCAIDSEGWVATVRELPGCLAQGETQADALANLREAMESWIEAMLDLGRGIPPPAVESTSNGRILLRIPASLHERLVWEANREGVSLNQYLLGVAAGAVGWRAPAREPVSIVPKATQAG